MERSDDFDGIVPMQMDDNISFASHGQQGTTTTVQRRTRMDETEKATNKSFFYAPANSFFHHHHYLNQQHQSPSVSSSSAFAVHQNHSLLSNRLALSHQNHSLLSNRLALSHQNHSLLSNRLALSAAQFPRPNSMDNFANNTNSHLGSEIGEGSHSHSLFTPSIEHQQQQQQAQWNAQWHQYHHHLRPQTPWSSAQMPPLRKESMPALHFNDRLSPQPSSAAYHPSNSLMTDLQQPSSLCLFPQMEHPLERTRSLSSAIFGSPSPPTTFGQFRQQQSHFEEGATHSTYNSNGAKADEQRRTKSTALPPTSFWSSLQPGPASLHRFHSQLRTPRRPSSSEAPSMSSLPVLKPYTPPPILSPMRNGIGLFHRIAQDENKSTLLDQPKPCSISDAINHFEGKEHNRCQLAGDEVAMADEAVAEEEDDERDTKRKENGGIHPSLIVTFHEQQQNGMEAEEESGAERRTPPPVDDAVATVACGRPQRKNGFLFSGDGPSSSGLNFAAELEQLRKQSNASGKIHKASIVRMSIRNKTSLANDDFVRKMSTVSMEEAKGEEPDEMALESDAIPHINLGKNYQARVKKWADRAISAQERDAISDRDQQIFESRTTDHIAQSALAAFETLACSVAVPKPGRNKELALHILAENQGNLQAAVMDLLRCDTLDWEQYPNIYQNSYVDVDDWSPEEISSFQDAIYKSEKDFQQVATELGNRSVRECVSFYYTWKKACPDDYRKLRNLRKKRQLLEQQLDFATIACRQLSQSESHNNGASSEEEQDEEFSETESDITNPSLLGPLSMDCSPAGLGRKHSLLPPTGDPSPHPSSSLLPHVASSSMFNSAYPWLHGDIFPSPSSSSTSTANNDHMHGCGTAQNGTTAAAGGGEMAGTADKEGGPGGHHQHNHSKEYGGGGHHHQHNNKIRSATTSKKGAQPSADGFFHCRLCEKRFEKVKSLNAHMKSHAMKARAEAEVQMQQKHQSQQQQQQQQSQSATALAFPIATKKEPADNALGSLASPLGAVASLNLTSSQAAVAAALNNLNRQFQQQHGGVQGAMGGIMGSNLLLRNMLQYGPAAAAAAQSGAATPGGGGTGTASQWPTQHFNT